MALILKRLRELHPETFSDENDYAVLSGAFHVGRVSRITGGPSDGSWTWAINGVHAGPAVMEKHGVAPDLEAAKAALAANWRKWLAWAALSERDHPPDLMPVMVARED